MSEGLSMLDRAAVRLRLSLELNPRPWLKLLVGGGLLLLVAVSLRAQAAMFSSPSFAATSTSSDVHLVTWLANLAALVAGVVILAALGYWICARRARARFDRLPLHEQEELLRSHLTQRLAALRSI